MALCTAGLQCATVAAGEDRERNALLRTLGVYLSPPSEHGAWAASGPVVTKATDELRPPKRRAMAAAHLVGDAADAQVIAGTLNPTSRCAGLGVASVMAELINSNGKAWETPTDRHALEQIEVHVQQASQLIDAYDGNCPACRNTLSTALHQVRQIVRERLEGWQAYDRATWAFLAGLPERAQLEYQRFAEALPLIAANDDCLRADIAELLDAVDVVAEISASPTELYSDSRELWCRLKRAAITLEKRVRATPRFAQGDLSRTENREPGASLLDDRVTQEPRPSLLRLSIEAKLGVTLLTFIHEASTLRTSTLSPRVLEQQYEHLFHVSDLLLREVRSAAERLGTWSTDEDRASNQIRRVELAEWAAQVATNLLATEVELALQQARGPRAINFHAHLGLADRLLDTASRFEEASNTRRSLAIADLRRRAEMMRKGAPQRPADRWVGRFGRFCGLISSGLIVGAIVIAFSQFVGWR